MGNLDDIDIQTREGGFPGMAEAMLGLADEEVVKAAIRAVAIQIAQLQPEEWVKVTRNAPADRAEHGMFTLSVCKKTSHEPG